MNTQKMSKNSTKLGFIDKILNRTFVVEFQPKKFSPFNTFDQTFFISSQKDMIYTLSFGGQ